MSGTMTVPDNIHSAGYGAVGFGDDAKLFVRFFRTTERDNARSADEGRPVFKVIDMIEIRQPGERDALHRPVKEEDQYRFPRHWAAFQASQDQTQVGTPLTYLFDAEPEIIAMMKELRIHTLEALANLTENGIQRLGMGGRKWVERAKEYLGGLQDAAAVRRLQEQVDEKDQRISTLEQQLKEVGDRLATLEKKGSRP